MILNFTQKGKKSNKEIFACKKISIIIFLWRCRTSRVFKFLRKFNLDVVFCLHYLCYDGQLTTVLGILGALKNLTTHMTTTYV